MASVRYLRVTMPDGSRWDVPLTLVEASWRQHYGGGMDYDDDQLMEWAENDMNWSDVEDHAIRCKHGADPDYQDGWVNGEKEIVTRQEEDAAPSPGARGAGAGAGGHGKDGGA